MLGHYTLLKYNCQVGCTDPASKVLVGTDCSRINSQICTRSWYNSIMEKGFQLYDVVTLTEDLQQHGLVRGQVGTIVEQYSLDAFEVEFVDNSGHTYGLVTLNSRQLLVLHYEPARAA